MSEKILPFLAQIITISGETIGVSIPKKYQRQFNVKVGDYVIVNLERTEKQEGRV
jgi:translation initiation factor IF-1